MLEMPHHLRLGEALGLLWEHVDLETGQIRVVHQLQRIDRRWQLVPPKSRQSRRTIPLPRASVTALRAHRELQQLERLAGGAEWGGPFDLVFTSTVGTPLDESNVRRQLRAILRQAGLRDIRFHDLRHTCASLLLVQGVHPRVVMETLGHSQISLTLDTYSHVLPVLQRDAAERMDALLRGSD
ncbi:MAG: site-specific integrase [Chloroflexota bacterium]